MKKTILVLLTVFVSMFMFVGCQKIELSEEEEKLFVAYAVNSVLKYDYDYTDKLLNVPKETTEESENPGEQEDETVDTNTPSGGNSPSGGGDISSAVEVSMTEVMDIDGFTFDITDYHIMKKYTAGTDDSAMTAAEGKNLLILDIVAKNHKDSAQMLNVIEQNIKFTAIVNNTKKMNPQIWVWSNGCTFNAFAEEFKAGETKKLMLAFQVDEELTISSLKLLIAKGEKEGYVTVK